MKTQDSPDNQSPEATRFERVRLYIKLHLRQFVTQGSVIAGWRESGGRRLGPYYRLIHRQDGRQQTLYLGKSEWLADEVRKLLAIVRRPFREAQALKRLQASARAGLRKAKAAFRLQLARFGLHLKGLEIRGLEALRRATRWGQLAHQRGVPCPRIMPLLELGDLSFPLPWHQGKKVAGTICATLTNCQRPCQRHTTDTRQHRMRSLEELGRPRRQRESTIVEWPLWHATGGSER